MSGTVIVDGQPAERVIITFEPKQIGENVISGPTSIGTTDEEGKFKLFTTTGDRRPAAVVGDHVVRIQGLEQYDRDSIQDAKSLGENVPSAAIPDAYSKDGVEFTVPENGTDEAIFDIKSTE
ncbi:hypothetical protein [Calycomorphotria hydatis]|uniref:hypothetical protein n=1 Tax=Calycomorphotria hydatis TaxID=2528027 RepID=UPI0011A01232|nr:hypothetical protein [Calycomorphotria hydatis]